MTINHPALTHHNVDDLPQIDDLAPWDQAMDALRSHLAFPFHRTDVSNGGKTMTIRLRGSKLVDNYLQQLRTVIVVFQLPLWVQRDRWAIGDVVFEDNLVITYRPEL